MITIEQLKKITPRALEDINKLLPQLSPNEKTISQDYLARIIEDENVELFVVKGDEAIVGMATLVFIRHPSGFEAFVEDVVIDEAYRGKGLGKQLMQKVIEEAKKRGVEYVELTSRESRIAANKLYQSLGFKKRETNVYTLKLQ